MYAAIRTDDGRLFVATRGGHHHLVRHAIRLRATVRMAQDEDPGGFGYATRTKRFIDAETARAKFGVACSEDLPSYAGRIALGDAEIVEVIR